MAKQAESLAFPEDSHHLDVLDDNDKDDDDDEGHLHSPIEMCL